MSILYKNIKARREELKMTQDELAKRLGYTSRSSIAKVESGKNDIPQSKIVDFANALNTTPGNLMGWEGLSFDAKTFPSNVLPIPKTKKVPRLGTIACGLPIFAEENIETYDSVDESLHCNFTLLCRGDSMLPKLQENDVVLICSQPDVENGQIAAVLIGEEATLKKVHKNENSLILTAENTVYPPMIYTGEQLENISIIGKVVGIIRYF